MEVRHVISLKNENLNPIIIKFENNANGSSKQKKRCARAKSVKLVLCSNRFKNFLPIRSYISPYPYPCLSRVRATLIPTCEKDSLHEDVTPAQARDVLSLFYLFCRPPSFFSFLKATSLFGSGAQSSLAKNIL